MKTPNDNQDVLVYRMSDQYDSSDVPMCQKHAAQAFPKGIDGVTVEALDADDGFTCDFCPEQKGPR